MQLVQGGSPRAFELLYDRHGGAAFSLAYRMVGNRVTAEDITQEAFLSIWRSRLRYDQARGSVRTWVLGIVHNRAIDALRRGTVHERRRETLEGVEERHEAKERTDVEAARREEARGVHSALDDASRGSAPDDRARLLRRLQPQPDRGDAGHAARDRQGPDAARPREDATPAGGASARGSWRDRPGSRPLPRRSRRLPARRPRRRRAAGLRAPHGAVPRLPRRGRAAAPGGRRAAALGGAGGRARPAQVRAHGHRARARRASDPARPARRRRLRDLLPGRALRPALAGGHGGARAASPGTASRSSARTRTSARSPPRWTTAAFRWPAPSFASTATATTAPC